VLVLQPKREVVAVVSPLEPAFSLFLTPPFCRYSPSRTTTRASLVSNTRPLQSVPSVVSEPDTLNCTHFRRAERIPIWLGYWLGYYLTASLLSYCLAMNLNCVFLHTEAAAAAARILNTGRYLIAVEHDEEAAVVVARSIHLVGPMSVQFGDRAEVCLPRQCLTTGLSILNC